MVLLVLLLLLLRGRQDPEEHGGGLGAGDHAVPQRVRRQPGDALLPLAALAQLDAVRPRAAPHAAQHDEEGVPAVSPPPLHLGLCDVLQILCSVLIN